jgi:transcriptional regulator with XRE-family HTH domain
VRRRVQSKSLQKKIGENIEHFRLQKKKTIKQMASLLHLSNSGYRNIERGITEVSLTKIFLIAEFLNVRVFQLLDFENNMTTINEGYANNQILEVYKIFMQQQKEENSFLRRQLELLTRQNKN